MLAIGAGGLDVACAMGGLPVNMVMPKIYGVRLEGRLTPGVSAKDVILELLRRETVKGGVGAVYEYFGEGAASLSVPERATITNMGAELGATSSVFPSDEVTQAFLTSRGRGHLWQSLCADSDARYDRIIGIDLSALRPLAACPHSPDNVKTVAELAGTPVDQVVIGSCTNSSIEDLAACAAIVRGKTVHPRVSAGLACGSRTTLLAAEKSGVLGELIRAGFRILECACGPCIGMGFAPKSAGVSLRTFNRNFKGRSGTADAGVYLVSPQTAAASAIAGAVRASVPDTGVCPMVSDTAHTDALLVAPLSPEAAAKTPLERGPNIKPCPLPKPVADEAVLPVLLKAGDNITTDDIMPAGAKVLPLRSNIPEISKFVFSAIDPDFWRRAEAAKDGCLIIGGTNYGQGSSREHAALGPMYLGVRAVIAKSFARIHKANLINYGILPLTFADADDYAAIAQGDRFMFTGLHRLLETETAETTLRLEIRHADSQKTLRLLLEADSRSRALLRSGGLIPHTKSSLR
jgi:aconitate hydratase